MGVPAPFWCAQRVAAGEDLVRRVVSATEQPERVSLWPRPEVSRKAKGAD